MKLEFHKHLNIIIIALKMVLQVQMHKELEAFKASWIGQQKDATYTACKGNAETLVGVLGVAVLEAGKRAR